MAKIPHRIVRSKNWKGTKGVGVHWAFAPKQTYSLHVRVGRYGSGVQLRGSEWGNTSVRAPIRGALRHRQDGEWNWFSNFGVGVSIQDGVSVRVWRLCLSLDRW